MAEVTIRNNLKKVGGNPLPGVLVSVNLSWDTSVSPVVKDDTGEICFQRAGLTVTDGSGDWSLVVETNDSLTPVDNVYKITEGNDIGSIFEYYISVVAGSTPSSDSEYWVGDLIVDTPAWED